MGVHFDPLENWNLPHFGLFWSRINHEYPVAEVHPLIASEGEVQEFEFGVGALQKQLKIPVRCWFINEDKTRLIQVQNNRFIHNWRRIRGSGGPYSHYDDLRPIFEAEWNRFSAFLEKEGIVKPNVVRCEVSYINHLDRGRGWQSFADLPDVFPSWSGRTSGGFLPPPQAAAIRTFYPIQRPEGRLEISAQPAVRQSDGKDIIQLSVTGLCKPTSSEGGQIFSALDAAHEWVVRGFTDFTSAKMHEIWRRKI